MKGEWKKEKHKTIHLLWLSAVHESFVPCAFLLSIWLNCNGKEVKHEFNQVKWRKSTRNKEEWREKERSESEQRACASLTPFVHFTSVLYPSFTHWLTARTATRDSFVWLFVYPFLTFPFVLVLHSSLLFLLLIYNAMKWSVKWAKDKDKEEKEPELRCQVMKREKTKGKWTKRASFFPYLCSFLLCLLLFIMCSLFLFLFGLIQLQWNEM